MNKKITIVVERLNTSRKDINKAVEEKDEALIIKEAKLQISSGATFLDVNCGSRVGTEQDDILWMLDKVLSNFNDINISLDSANPEVIKKALPTLKGRNIIINSITLEPNRAEKILPLVKEYNASVIALTIDSNGMPKDVDDRLEIIEKILNKAKEYDINNSKLYIDPLVRPLSTEPDQAMKFISTLIKIKESFDLKVISGVSNISFGLPRRNIINAFFLSLCIYNGMDAAILDPSQKLIQSALKATHSISGQDQYCMDYIKSWREGKL